MCSFFYNCRLTGIPVVSIFEIPVARLLEIQFRNSGPRSKFRNPDNHMAPLYIRVHCPECQNSLLKLLVALCFYYAILCAS
jgi:hypothetical protein